MELCSEVGKVITQGPSLQQFSGNESDPQKYPLGLLRDIMSELTLRIRLSQGKTGFQFPVAITQSSVGISLIVLALGGQAIEFVVGFK